MPNNSVFRFTLGRWLAPVALGAALLVLLGSALTTYRNVKRFANMADWVSHSREVLATTEGVLAELSKAESAGRGFLLSGKAIYRSDFDAAVSEALKRQAALHNLTLHNPSQKRRVAELDELIAPKLDLMKKFVSYRESPEPDSAEEARMLENGVQQMSVIRGLVNEIQREEDDLLIKRRTELRRRNSRTELTLLASTLVASGLVLGTYFLLRRHWRLQQTSATQTVMHRREKNELARYNQRLLESTGEGIYGIDTKGLCTLMNRAGAIILGGRPDEFLGKDMHQLIHHTTTKGDAFPVDNCPIYKASQTGDGCRVDDELFRRLDGESVPVEYSSFPIKDGERVEGAVITFNDITTRLRAQQELKRAKDAAEMANESKSQFLANMSHELRTPLNAVIMYSELLAEEAEDQDVPDFIPDLKRIRSAGKHLLELVNGVLDLSKIEAGKMELFPEDFNIPNMITEVATTIEPLMEKNRNSLQVKISPDVESMYGDVTKLRQVLYNLLSNASKFTEDGTIQLRVSRKSAENAISFEVIDSGIGMSEEQVSRLFKPFMQADASTTRKYGGTGLGLAIIKRFTDLMQGEVEVASVQNKGTTFTVVIPEQVQHRAVNADLAESAEKMPDSITERSKVLDGAVAEGARVVLVVDDDPSIRDILTRVLVNEGIRPVTAVDGAEGLQRAKELRPDLIILDALMPKVDGWSVLATLKADETLADIPVIMQSISDDRNLGFMLGASEYLVKPVDRGKLVSLLQKYIQSDNASVLVVDDDESTRRAVAKALKRQGWRVMQAGNGSDALEQMRNEQPAAILLDLMMPVMDGFEFLEQMHDQPDWQPIPVVVLTAKELTAEDRLRLNGGVERVLAKGALSRDRFLDEVRRIVATVTGRLPLTNSPASDDGQLAQQGAERCQES